MKVVAVSKQALQKQFPNASDATVVFESSVALIYIGIFCVIAAITGLKGNPLFYLCAIPAMIAIGLGQYALAQAAHEAVHHHLPRKSLRSSVNAVALFYALGMTTDYQRLHMAHHTHFGDSQHDPDYPVYMRFPKSQRDFALFLLKSVSGFSALMRFFQINVGHGGQQKKILPKNHRQELLKMALTQLALLSLFSVFTGNPLFYFLFWLLPIVIVVKTLVDLRLLAEHGGEDKPALRTFLKNDLITWILGAYGFQNHAEHHILPAIHYRELPRVTDFILKSPPESAAGIPVEYIEDNHLQFLWKKYTLLPEKTAS